MGVDEDAFGYRLLVDMLGKFKAFALLGVFGWGWIWCVVVVVGVAVVVVAYLGAIIVVGSEANAKIVEKINF